MTTITRVKRSLRGCRPKLSLGLCLFESGYCLDVFGFLISLPFMDRWAYEPHEIMEEWRVMYSERAFWFHWGKAYKAFHMPWDFTFISHEVRRADGSWVPFVGCWETGNPIHNTNGVLVFEGGKEPDGRHEETFTYHYTLRSGEVQERTATVYAERREWRQKWLKWCPLFARKRQSISVNFDGEVGERTGSWKGGTIGCGWDLKPRETLGQALRRMEREREFE